MIALLLLEWLESSYVTACVHYCSHHNQMPIKYHMEGSALGAHEGMASICLEGGKSI